MIYGGQKREPYKNFYMVPNAVMRLGLTAGEIAVYNYLLYCEDRNTYQCYPSHSTIGEALCLSKHTVLKHVKSLEEKCLISTERTTVTLKNGKKQNGNLLYTIRPIQEALDNYYAEQLRKAEQEFARWQAQKRLEKYDKKTRCQDKIAVVIIRSRLKCAVTHNSHRTAEPTVWGFVTNISAIKQKGEKMSNKPTDKYKFTVRMNPETEAEMRKFLLESHEKSLNDFVVNAIEFYIGYLRQGENLDFISPILASAIKAEVRTMERNISEMLFKVAVQISVLTQIIADENDFREEYIEELYKWCAGQVASTNGILDLESIIKFGKAYGDYNG